MRCRPTHTYCILLTVINIVEMGEGESFLFIFAAILTYIYMDDTAAY